MGEADGSRLLRWVPFGVACAVGLALRLAGLGERPLHHDEGMIASLVADLLDGYRFAYDPQRLHGPFTFFFGVPALALLGPGEVALRLPVALTSALLIPLLLPLRRRLGVAGITAAAWLLAVSPSLVYYGRDLIPETYLVFFTLALVVAVSVGMETGRSGAFLLAAAAAGLMFTVKETALLSVATLAGAAGVVWRRGPGMSRRTLLGAGAVFAGIWILLFTSFFTNPGGIVDSVRAFLLWAGKGIEGSGGHIRSWDFFARLLFTFETPLVLCALAGAFLAVRRRDRFGLFCALWTAGQLAIYSALPYKTPWLVLNVVVPAALTAGVLFREIPARAGFLLAFALAWTGWRAVDVSFLRYDDDQIPLIYAPTDRDLRNLLAFVDGVAERSPEGKGITVKLLSPHLWPLPWYFRGYPNAVYRRRLADDPRPDADVVIVDVHNEGRLRLRGRYVRRVFRLRPHEPVGVWVASRTNTDEHGPPRTPKLGRP
ncbi:MAG TPA: flippase activity-associated protein Agl23 [Thermoanaerobaculia bacterium]|nr:flippase activity-associated protein Agl23 [Thermoanaerobaculia bacterium]